MKKGDVGMANASLKSTEPRDELSTTCNRKSKLCQDACQHLMLHPYITASRTIINILLLSRIQALDLSKGISLSQEQAAKTNMLSVIGIQVFSIMYS